MLANRSRGRIRPYAGASVPLAVSPAAFIWACASGSISATRAGIHPPPCCGFCRTAACPGGHPERRQADPDARPSGVHRAARDRLLLPRLSGQVAQDTGRHRTHPLNSRTMSSACCCTGCGTRWAAAGSQAAPHKQIKQRSPHPNECGERFCLTVGAGLCSAQQKTA